MTALNKYENYKRNNKNKTGKVVELNKMENEEYKYLNYEEIKELKQKFVDDYFAVQFVDYDKLHEEDKDKKVKVDPFFRNQFIKRKKWGKSFDFIYQPTTEASRSMVKKAWRSVKKPFDGDFEEFNAVVMLSVCNAVECFDEDQTKFNWENINEIGTFECNRLHSYVANAVYADVRLVANQLQNVERRQTRVDGRRQDVYLYLGSAKIESIDEVVIDGDGQEVFIHEYLSNDSNYFNYTSQNKFEKSHFLQFFYENFETKMLTNAQREFLKVFPRFYVGDKSKGYNDLKPYSQQEEHNRPYNQKQIDYMFKAINDRVTRAYNDAYPSSMSNDKLKIMKEETTLNYLLQLESDQKLSDFILNAVAGIEQELHQGLADNLSITDILYDKMENIHSMNVNEAKMMKKPIRTETLKEFVNQTHERLGEINELKEANVQVKKFYKKDEEFLFESRDELLKRKGERQEAEDQYNEKYKIRTLLPSGAEIEVNRLLSKELQDFLSVNI